MNLKEHTTIVKALRAYNNACEDIASLFVEKYYNTYPEFTDESYWIADDVGGVLEINDDFWGIDDMRTALSFGVSEKLLFEWHSASLDAHTKGRDFINLRNFILQN